MTDRQLVEKALQGDTAAFGTLVEKYQGMVCGLAVHHVGSFDDAEDIAQQTFLGAYQGLESLRQRSRFASWLRGIAQNKIRMWLRKRKSSKEVATDFGEESMAAQVATRPPADAEQTSLRESVLRAIESLPKTQRLAVTLYYMDGESYGDIAGFLGVPTSTVKGRLQTGRKRLRKEMMSMVEGILRTEKPGHDLTVKILRKAMGQAKRARKERDYEVLIQYCDEALRALEKLPPTRRRQAKKVDLLTWRADARTRWFVDTTMAIADYEAACRLAAELGDDDAQVKLTRDVLVTYGTSGRFRELKKHAKGGLAMAEALGHEELAAFCEAAVDLASDRRRKWRPGKEGGFVLSYFHLKRDRRGLLLGAPALTGPQHKRNISVNLTWGLPQMCTVFSYAHGPGRLLCDAPESGRSWRGPVSRDLLAAHMPGTALRGKTIVESTNASVSIGARRFRRCLRIRTTISETPRTHSSDSISRYLVQCHGGTRWMWFAPGIGLVKLRYLHNNGPLTDIELTDAHVVQKTADHFPLAVGNYWRYEWFCRFRGVFAETCRVVQERGGSYTISCATHALGLSHKAARPHRQRKDRTVRRARREARHGSRAADNRNDKANRLLGAATQHFREGNPAEMLQASEQALSLFRELGYKDRETDAAAWVDMARGLAQDTGANIGGYLVGHAKPLLDARNVRFRYSGSSTSVPVQEHCIRFIPSSLSPHRAFVFPVRVGKSWTAARTMPAPTGSKEVLAKGAIQARGRKIDVPAGRFSDCVVVKTVLRAEEVRSGPNSPEGRWKGYTEGTRIDWYALGVGPVKVEYRHANGKTTHVELVEHKLKRRSKSYFPDTVGNRWQYLWRDEAGVWLFREFWRIAAKEGRAAYLGFGAYEFLH